MQPRPIIEAFDLHMHGLGLNFEGIVIGGAALALMGVIQRPTRDFDILVPELPDGNELWPAHVRATFDDLARRLGHGV